MDNFTSSYLSNLVHLYWRMTEERVTEENVFALLPADIQEIVKANPVEIWAMGVPESCNHPKAKNFETGFIDGNVRSYGDFLVSRRFRLNAAGDIEIAGLEVVYSDPARKTIRGYDIKFETPGIGFDDDFFWLYGDPGDLSKNVIWLIQEPHGDSHQLFEAGQTGVICFAEENFIQKIRLKNPQVKFLANGVSSQGDDKKWHHDTETFPDREVISFLPTIEEAEGRSSFSIQDLYQSRGLAGLKRALANPRGVQELGIIQPSCWDRHWDRNPPKEREWLVQNVLLLARLVLLIGSGGVGKTRLSINLAVAIAAGIPDWLGFPIHLSGPVLLWSCEEELEEGQRRIMQEVCALDEGFRQKALKNLYFESRLGKRTRLTAPNPKTGKIEQSALVQEIIEGAKVIPDLKLIVIDPLSLSHGGDENSSQDMSTFVQVCEHIANQTGATVMVLHHISKLMATNGGSGMQQAARGSSALVDGARMVMNLSGVTGADAKRFSISEERQNQFVTLTNSKNNYALKFPNLCLDLRGAIKRAQGEQNAMELIQGTIADGGATGTRYTRSGFVEAFAGVDARFKLSKAGLDALLKTAIDEGKILCKPRSGRGGGDELFLPDEVSN